MECTNCRGKGTYQDCVRWSDGLGMVDAKCPLCDGVGMIESSPTQLAIEYKRQAAQLAHDYRQFVVHTALYLKTSRGELPDPPFVDAPGPSPHASTWLGYLCREIKKLPRVQAKNQAASAAA